MTEEKKKHPNTSVVPIDAPISLDYCTFLHLDFIEVEGFFLSSIWYFWEREMETEQTEFKWSRARGRRWGRNSVITTGDEGQKKMKIQTAHQGACVQFLRSQEATVATEAHGGWCSTRAWDGKTGGGLCGSTSSITASNEALIPAASSSIIAFQSLLNRTRGVHDTFFINCVKTKSKYPAHFHQWHHSDSVCAAIRWWSLCIEFRPTHL